MVLRKLVLILLLKSGKRKLGENHPSIEKIKEIHEELVLRFE